MLDSSDCVAVLDHGAVSRKAALIDIADLRCQHVSDDVVQAHDAKAVSRKHSDGVVAHSSQSHKADSLNTVEELNTAEQANRVEPRCHAEIRIGMGVCGDSPGNV